MSTFKLNLIYKKAPNVLILLISDLLDLGFNAEVVFGLGKDFLFKSILGRYVRFTNLGLLMAKDKADKDSLRAAASCNSICLW